MIRRFWQWLKGWWRKPSEPVTHDYVRESQMPKDVQAVKSANICMASQGATKRERRFARTYLRQIHFNFR